MADLDPTSLDLTLTASGDLSADQDPVLQDALLRLTIHRGSCFWDPRFGSTLHELRRAKVGASFRTRLEQRVRDALLPLLDAGDLLSLRFEHERPAANRWAVRLLLHTIGDRAGTLTFALEVS